MSDRYLYDWIPGQRGRMLIYVGRTPNHIDPGCKATLEVLRSLLKKKILTGQALIDATKQYEY
jgi:hypothetical protein